MRDSKQSIYRLHKQTNRQLFVLFLVVVGLACFALFLIFFFGGQNGN